MSKLILWLRIVGQKFNDRKDNYEECLLMLRIRKYRLSALSSGLLFYWWLLESDGEKLIIEKDY